MATDETMDDFTARVLLSLVTDLSEFEESANRISYSNPCDGT